MMIPPEIARILADRRKPLPPERNAADVHPQMFISGRGDFPHIL